MTLQLGFRAESRSQLLPTVLKSAMQSTNTVIFVPSSFDFIRVENYIRKHEGMTFSVLSEYVSGRSHLTARLTI